MRLMLAFCHLIMSSNKIKAWRFQCKCVCVCLCVCVCALLWLFHPFRLRARARTRFLASVEKRARQCPPPPPGLKQPDRVTERRQTSAPLLSPSSALSNDCVQCEVARARAISLCNYVTRSKKSGRIQLCFTFPRSI